MVIFHSYVSLPEGTMLKGQCSPMAYSLLAVTKKMKPSHNNCADPGWILVAGSATFTVDYIPMACTSRKIWDNK